MKVGQGFFYIVRLGFVLQHRIKENKMARWDEFTVEKILSMIEDGEMVLPVIQRRLVWDEDKMSLLFDTVMSGNSFGGIVAVIELSGSVPLFAYRTFTKDGQVISSQKSDKVVRTHYFIIDGQQRLQSFYIGLKGSINGKHLCFDMVRRGGFIFTDDDAKLPKEADDDYDPETKNKCCWISVRDLFQLLVKGRKSAYIADQYIDKFASDFSSEFKSRIRDNVTTFYSNFIDNKVIGVSCVTLPEDNVQQNRAMVVELFRRLNDGGTRLSPIDLIASVFKSLDWRMEDFLESIAREYSDIGLTQDNFIKLLFILNDQPKKDFTFQEDVSNIVGFTIEKRTRVENSLKALVKFLENSELLGYYKGKRESFIPLFFIVYHVFHSKLETEKLPYFFDKYDTKNLNMGAIYRWMLHSLLNNVFRSKGAGWIPYKTGINKIHACMQLHKGESFPGNELYKVYAEHPLPGFSCTYSEERLDNLNMSFLFYQIYKDGGVLKRQNDVDHIMAKAKLEGKDPQKINSIANFQLLDLSDNRGKQDAYLKEWINKHVENKKVYLETHLIPQDESLWDEQNCFEQFLEARAKLLCEKIAKFFA